MLNSSSHGLNTRHRPASLFSTPYPSTKQPRSRKSSDDDKNNIFYEFDVIFEDTGPLMMNVMGTVDRDENGKRFFHLSQIIFLFI